MDFSPIEKHIQAGQLEQARRRLKKVELEKLTTAQLLTYFRYMRRVGEFHRGALLLEQYDQVLPELDLERAYFLGELGAFRQALQLLQKNILPLTSFDQQIEKQLHIGHFSSLAHNYPAAIQGYAEMA
ncbi:MAG TPA: hypothetical protein VN132_14720, partial [Bdellovibrio sp.]|nr:hypothetical protein [Bdellovibrio sp.]